MKRSRANGNRSRSQSRSIESPVSRSTNSPRKSRIPPTPMLQDPYSLPFKSLPSIPEPQSTLRPRTPDLYRSNSVSSTSLSELSTPSPEHSGSGAVKLGSPVKIVRMDRERGSGGALGSKSGKSGRGTKRRGDALLGESGTKRKRHHHSHQRGSSRSPRKNTTHEVSPPPAFSFGHPYSATNDLGWDHYSIVQIQKPLPASTSLPYNARLSSSTSTLPWDFSPLYALDRSRLVHSMGGGGGSFSRNQAEFGQSLPPSGPYFHSNVLPSPYREPHSLGSSSISLPNPFPIVPVEIFGTQAQALDPYSSEDEYDWTPRTRISGRRGELPPLDTLDRLDGKHFLGLSLIGMTGGMISGGGQISTWAAGSGDAEGKRRETRSITPPPIGLFYYPDLHPSPLPASLLPSHNAYDLNPSMDLFLLPSGPPIPPDYTESGDQESFFPISSSHTAYTSHPPPPPFWSRETGHSTPPLGETWYPRTSPPVSNPPSVLPPESTKRTSRCRSIILHLLKSR